MVPLGMMPQAPGPQPPGIMHHRSAVQQQQGQQQLQRSPCMTAMSVPGAAGMMTPADFHHMHAMAETAAANDVFAAMHNVGCASPAWFGRNSC